MQRHLRAQSATKKHERLCQEQQDRHRALVEKTDSKDGKDVNTMSLISLDIHDKVAFEKLLFETGCHDLKFCIVR